MPEVMTTGAIAYPDREAAAGPPSWQGLYPDELGGERKAALSAYWRALFAGEGVPQTLAVPPEARRAVARALPEVCGERPLREALHEYALRWLYGGDWVAYLDSPRGPVVVAVSRPEFVWLDQCVSREMVDRTTTTYPPPWEEVAE